MQFRQASRQAKVQRQQADFTRRQSEIDADEFKRRQRRLLGSARAARGASGVDLLQGSPLLVDDDTITEIVFGAESIRRGGQVQATRLEQQAGLTQAAGTGALLGGVASGASTVLTSDIFSTPGPGAGSNPNIASNNRFSSQFGGQFVP